MKQRSVCLNVGVPGGRSSLKRLLNYLAIACLVFAFGLKASAVAAQPHGDAATGPAHAVSAHGSASDAHGDPSDHAEHGHVAPAPELPNFVSLILDTNIGGKTGRDTPIGHALHAWEKQIFLILVTGLALFGISKAARLRAMKPGKIQSLMELMHQGLYSFLGGILGEKNTKYVPFLGTVFLFIWINNLAGIIPGFTASTAVYPTTLALALLVITYVQVQGIKAGGFKHYIMHFFGNPKDFSGWILGICLLPLELIGFVAKPVSLSLRLFGNIMGEHILVGVFLILGLTLMGAFFPDPPVGVPLHLPFLFLSLLTCTVQALVFTLLSTIYLMLLLPHEEHDEHHHHNERREGLPNDEGNHVGGGHISPV